MKNILIVLAMLFSLRAFAQNIGVSTHPFSLKSSVINAELANNTSNGTGTGVNLRYYNRLADDVNMDVGYGVNSGDRENRFFLGTDYRLFPDYGYQPRISVKGMYSYGKEFDQKLHRIGFAPTISKGFNVNGNEVFPFVAIPLQLQLNSTANNYQTVNTLALGVTGRIQLDNSSDVIIANLETQFNLRNSYNAIVLGISVPLN
ncbi:MAG: hypothetical protein JNM93_00830 [Bacteriovoracaceae bacterium]|nr:hypothetical protein [Bacteriovoracaceae bacterium]